MSAAPATAAGRSLTRTLLTWLLPLFGAAAVVSGAATYWGYGRFVRTFLDDQLSALADSYARAHDAADAPLSTAREVHTWGAPVVQWFDAGGHLRRSTFAAMDVPAQAGAGFHDVADSSGQGWRVLSVQAPAGVIQVSQSDAFRRHQAAALAVYAAVPIGLLLPLAMLAAYAVVTRASREMRAIARAAADQDEQSIAPLPVARVPEEVAPLIVGFNALLARLDRAFVVQRQFVQDAAHELRTPLAALELQIENLRTHLAPAPAEERWLRLEQGLQRMRRLVEQLLRLARQEAPEQKAPDRDAPVVVSLEEVLRQGVSDLIVAADRGGVEIAVEAECAAESFVLARAADLRTLFDNLVDNAIRHSAAGSSVTIRIHRIDGRPVVDVVDEGPGIPAEYLQRAFDRFFRVPGDPQSGSGLGLAIAAAAAQRNGLRIELLARPHGGGLVARVHLGAAARAAAAAAPA